MEEKNILTCVNEKNQEKWNCGIVRNTYDPYCIGFNRDCLCDFFAKAANCPAVVHTNVHCAKWHCAPATHFPPPPPHTEMHMSIILLSIAFAVVLTTLAVTVVVAYAKLRRYNQLA